MIISVLSCDILRKVRSGPNWEGRLIRESKQFVEVFGTLVKDKDCSYTYDSLIVNYWYLDIRIGQGQVGAICKKVAKRQKNLLQRVVKVLRKDLV